MPTDPYATLGLTSAASAKAIKQAYRKLARTCHPDLHPGDAAAEARFKEISAAHDLLKNPASRARFDAGETDASGAERPRPRQNRGDDPAAAPADHPPRGFGARFEAGDLFAEMFRRHNGGTGAAPSGHGVPVEGRDLRFALDVPFLDAACGSDLRLTLGVGGDVSVRIPPGARDGLTLRLQGKGDPGLDGGAPGDALITLSLRPHPVFRREGDDILMTLPITIDEAVLGGKVTAPTITGPVSLTIPAGASSGQTLRLRGRGVARSGGKGMGDQRVELRIVAPTAIDIPLRDFLTEWRSTQVHDPLAEVLRAAAS